MKKKLTATISIFIIAVLLVIYFFPQPLDKVVIPNGSITIILRSYYLEDAKPILKANTYEFLPNTDSYDAIMSIFSKYSYRRNLRSLFIANKIGHYSSESFQIYFADDTKGRTLLIGGTGEFLFDEHSYQMGIFGNKKQNLFINQIKSILEKETPVNQTN